MKTYRVKNYKGNIVESLKRFSVSHKDVRIVEAVEDGDDLKIKTEAINKNKFEVGCKYSWWSKTIRDPAYLGDFVVVEVAPDRSYVLVVSLKNKNDLGAKKYKIVDDGNGGEKISDHPMAYGWRIARADKGGEYVGVPEGWHDESKARRHAGAIAASETRNIKSMLNKLQKKLTKEHFYKLKAAVFKDKFDSWEAMQKYWRENGWDKELAKYNPADKTRKNGKTAYRLFFGPKDATPFEIYFDGENFSDGYDKLSDEEIREILSDIL